MFNLGSNDKEELQENMQEIKNLIQSDEDGAGQPSANQQGSSAGGFGSLDQDSPNQQSQDSPQTGFEEKVRESHEREQQQQNQQPPQSPSDFQTSQQGQQRQANNEQPSQEQVLNQENSQNSNQKQETGSSKPEINTSSSPSREEPMFLREEEFLNIREMIEEMGYLTKEMDQNIDDLKKTLHNERNTTKDALDLVQAFSKRRAEIESTIESGQK